MLAYRMRDFVRFETLYFVAYADTKYESGEPIQEERALNKEKITREVLTSEITKFHDVLAQRNDVAELSKVVRLLPLLKGGAVKRIASVKATKDVKKTRIGTRTYKGNFNEMPIFQVSDSGVEYLLENWDQGVKMFKNLFPDQELVHKYLLKRREHKESSSPHSDPT